MKEGYTCKSGSNKLCSYRIKYTYRYFTSIGYSLQLTFGYMLAVFWLSGAVQLPLNHERPKVDALLHCAIMLFTKAGVVQW